MRPSDLQLLQVIQRGLSQLSSAVDSLECTRLISQLNIAVGELLSRSTGPSASILSTCDAAKVLALSGAELIREFDAGQLLCRVQALPPLRRGEVELLQDSLSAVKQLLVECVRSITTILAAGHCEPIWSVQVKRFFEGVAELEAQRASEDVVAAPAAERHDRASFDLEKLSEYLHRGDDQRAPYALVEARSLSGGYSRQTILVKVLDAANQPLALVIRKQLSGGLLGSSCLNLAQEIPFLQLAHRAGLPVPEVLWHETDAGIIAGEFVVLSCMPGSPMGSSVAASGTVDETLVRELAAMLARLHTIDWSSAAKALCASSGLPPEKSVSSEAAAIAACEAYEDLWRASDLGPLPTLEIILDWLKRNIPVTNRAAMISHGDIGFHNLMGENERLSALLDWETARIADPAKDMAMVRNFITSYVPWDRFVGWYRAAGGPVIDESSLEYYSIYYSFAHLVVCEVAIGARFSRESKLELEYLQLGIPVKAFFSQKMLANCARIWRTK